jgi:hypothetical protein
MFVPIAFQQPQIVTTGLIFSLDAADRTSYPGYGTTWTSLNGPKTAALTNGPSFSSTNGGIITFDGVDDFARIDANTFGYSPGTTGELTLEMWVYPTGPFTSYVAEPPTTNLGGFFGQSYFDASTGWGLGTFTSNGNNYWAFQVRNSGNIVQSGADSNLIFTTGSWYHVVGSFTRNDFSRTYINGQLRTSISSTSLNGITLTPNNLNARIGSTPNFFSGCRIAVAKLYNRPLSTSEVAQNFNAQRQRFNI